MSSSFDALRALATKKEEEAKYYRELVDFIVPNWDRLKEIARLSESYPELLPGTILIKGQSRPAIVPAQEEPARAEAAPVEVQQEPPPPAPLVEVVPAPAPPAPVETPRPAAPVETPRPVEPIRPPGPVPAPAARVKRPGGGRGPQDTVESPNSLIGMMLKAIGDRAGKDLNTPVDFTELRKDPLLIANKFEVSNRFFTTRSLLMDRDFVVKGREDSRKNLVLTPKGKSAYRTLVGAEPPPAGPPPSASPTTASREPVVIGKLPLTEKEVLDQLPCKFNILKEMLKENGFDIEGLPQMVRKLGNEFKLYRNGVDLLPVRTQGVS